MSKKYELHLNENQVKQILIALDFYTRISLGQLKELKNINDNVSERTLDKLQNEMFPILTGLNHSFGITEGSEEVKICYDIYKKIMFIFDPVGVYANKPYALSKEELPYFEKQKRRTITSDT